jgi:UDP-glucuronate 4-epimerase
MTGAVLVTGGRGFLGSHFVRALVRRGRHVVAFDLSAGDPSVPSGDQSNRVANVVGDVNDTGAILDLIRSHGVTDVVHTAALIGEPQSLSDPRRFLRVNTESVWDMCDAFRHIAIRRLICISTRSAYGSYPPEDGPLPETAALRPEAFYGASKAAADIVLETYRAHFELDVVAARITGLYGPAQTYHTPLSEMVEAAVKVKQYRKPSGAGFRYELTYVKDVVRGLLSLLDAERVRYPIYNITAGEQPRLSEVAEIVRTCIPGAVIELGEEPDERLAPRALMDGSRLAEETGYLPAWSMADGVRELVEWYRHKVYGREIEPNPSA